MADKEVSFTVRVQDAASAALDQISSAADKVTAKLFSFKDILGGIVATAGALSLGAIVKDMIDLGVASDQTFRTIANNLPTFTQGISDLRDGMDDLALASGRSLEEIQQAGIAIAQAGVTSSTDLQQQLTAATDLADATGTSVASAAQLLQQLRREFGLTGGQALDMAAKLAEAAKGHVSIDDLLSSFTRATPIFQKFGIDADTGTRAIIALVQSGVSARAIGQDLNQLDGTGIKQLADRAQIAKGYMDDFSASIANTRDGASRSAQAIKTEFTVAIEGIFAKVGGPNFLKGLADSLLFISQISFKNLLEIIADPSVATFARIAAQAAAPKQGFQFGGGGGFDGRGASGTFGGTSGTANPLAGIDTKTTEAAAKALETVNDDLVKLLATTDQAQPKSEAFGAAIEAWADKALKAKMPLDDLSVALGKLDAIQGQMQAQEVDEAFRKLNDAVDATQGPVGVLNKQMSDLFDTLTKGRAVLVANGADTTTYDATLQHLHDTSDKYHDAVEDSVAVNTELDKVQSDLRDATQGGDLDYAKLTGDLAALRAVANSLEISLSNAVPNSDSAKEYRQELEKVLAAIQGITTALASSAGSSTTTFAKDLTTDLESQARMIQQAVDGAVQLGEAFGVVGKNVGDILRSLGQMAADIPVLLNQIDNLNAKNADGTPADGATSMLGVIGAAVPVVGAIATVVTSLTGMVDAQNKATDALNQATTALLAGTKSYSNGPGGANSVQTQIDNNNTQLQTLLTQLQAVKSGLENAAGKKAGDVFFNDAQQFGDLPTAASLQTQHDQNLEQIASTFLDSLTQQLNAASGPAGVLANQLDQLQTTFDNNLASLDALRSAGAISAAQYAAGVQEATDAYNTSKAAAQAAAAEQARAAAANIQLATESADAYTFAAKQQLERDQLAEQQAQKLAAATDATTEAMLETEFAAENAALAVKQFADAINNVNSSVSQANDIFGISGTPQGVLNLASSYNASNPIAKGALRFDLSSYDLTTAAGDQAAISYLQGLFQGLDPSNPSYSVYAGEIQTLIDQIRGLPSFSASATGAASTSASASLPSTGISATGSSVGAVTQVSGAQADSLVGIGMTSLTYLAYLPSIDASLKTFALPTGTVSPTTFGNIGQFNATMTFYVQNGDVMSFIAQLNNPAAMAALEQMLGRSAGRGRSATGAARK